MYVVLIIISYLENINIYELPIQETYRISDS